MASSFLRKMRAVGWPLRILLLALLLLQLLYAFVYCSSGSSYLSSYLHKKVEQKCKSLGYSFNAQSLRFLSRGVFLVEQGSLGLSQNNEAVISFDRLLVRYDPFYVLLGDLRVEQVEAHDVSISIPAILSPTGATEAIAWIDEVLVEHSWHGWDILSFMGNVRSIPIDIAGHFHLVNQVQEQGLATLSWSKTVDALYRTCAYLDAAQDPLVSIVMDGSHLSLTAYCKSYGLNAEHELINLGLDLVCNWESHPVLFKAISHTDVLKSSSLIIKNLWLGAQGALDTEAQVRLNASGSLLEYDSMPAISPVNFGVASLMSQDLMGDYRAWASSEGLLLATRGWVDVLSGSLYLSGRFDLESNLISKMNQALGATVLEDLDISRLSSESLFLKCHSSWKLDKAQCTFDAGKLSIDFLNLNAARGTLVWEDDVFYLNDTVFNADSFTLEGDFLFDLSSLDYQVYLRGQLNPYELYSWFPSWWPNLWQSFLFTQEFANIDIDLKGNIGRNSLTSLYGSGNGESFYYNQVFIDACEVKFRVLPFHVDIFDLSLKRPEGSAMIDLQWLYHPMSEDPYTVIFAGSGNFYADKVGQLVGFGLNDLLRPVHSEISPYFSTQGQYLGSMHNDYGNHLYDIHVNTPYPIGYEGLMLDRASFHAAQRGGTLAISDISFGLANGQGRGEMTLAGAYNEDLRFSLELSNCKYLGLESVFSYVSSRLLDYDKKDLQQALLSSIDGDTDSIGGIVDLEASGSGDWRDLKSFEIEGDCYLRDANLGKIYLLGGLSKSLESKSVKIARVRFSKMTSLFKLQDLKLYMHDLKISGGTMELRGKGIYDLEDKLLDFKWNLYLLGRVHLPFISQALSLIDPVSNLLGISLNGTLDDPKWTVKLAPLGLGH